MFTTAVDEIPSDFFLDASLPDRFWPNVPVIAPVRPAFLHAPTLSFVIGRWWCRDIVQAAAGPVSALTRPDSELRQIPQPISCRPQRCVSVCPSAQAVGGLVVCHSSCDPALLLHTASGELFPFRDQPTMVPERELARHNGIPPFIYRDHVCLRYLKSEAWPPKSRDITWISSSGENWRGWCAVKIQGIDNLKQRLRLCWARISQHRVVKAIQAFTKRLKGCIARRGGHFELRPKSPKVG